MEVGASRSSISKLRDLPINDFLETPIIIGCARDLKSSSRFNNLKLSAVVLPNPIPGSIKILIIPADSAFLTGTATEIVGVKSIEGLKMKSKWEDSMGYVLAAVYQHRIKRDEHEGLTIV